MIIEVMRALLLILTLSFACFSETKNITVINVFSEVSIYNDGVTYNIASFDYVDTPSTDPLPDDIDFSKDSNTIKVGIVSTNNILVDLIWEYQSMSTLDPTNFIQSIELFDLNQDQSKDIIISYNDLDGDFPDQVISSFLINHKNKFEEISETFVKNRYTFIENSHIRYETPLSMFGRPYIEEDTQKESIYWVDHYEFKGLKLVNINQKYRSFFENYRNTSTKKMSDLLDQVKQYKMTEEITINQLQLEEYFNQITELKTIIHRSNKVLY